MLSQYPNLKDYLQLSWQLPGKWPAFLEHLFAKLDETIKSWWRVLVLTLTKKSAEDISNFLLSKWYKAYYLHSEIDTIDRWEIIKRLKSWEIDVLVWINLLREWIDLPEVKFIAILDADKEWFLRSTTSLVQIIWRAARNPDSQVVLYADDFTESLIKSLWETYRRRQIQDQHNKKHWIDPKQAFSNIKSLDVVKTDENLELKHPIVNKWKVKRLKRMTKKEKEIILADLKRQMDESIKNWEFEKAAVLRDQIKDLSWD